MGMGMLVIYVALLIFIMHNIFFRADSFFFLAFLFKKLVNSIDIFMYLCCAAKNCFDYIIKSFNFNSSTLKIIIAATMNSMFLLDLD